MPKKTIQEQIDELQAKADELAPRVAEFNDRGRKQRELTRADKRLALDKPEEFDAKLKELQAEFVACVRDAAAFDVLHEEIDALRGQLEAERLDGLRETRSGLVEQRVVAAEELEECMRDFDKALKSFFELSNQINTLDRQLGEPDKNRASYGLVALHVRRALHQASPTLAKFVGAKRVSAGASLSETVAGKDPLEA